MTTIESFENLEIWKKARTISQKIYAVTLSENFSKDLVLRNQINSTSGLIMDKIAEGFDRDGRKEFIQFLLSAKSSASELKSQLYRSVDRGYISTNEFDKFQIEITDLIKMLESLVHYLKKTSIEGLKFLKEPVNTFQ